MRTEISQARRRERKAATMPRTSSSGGRAFGGFGQEFGVAQGRDVSQREGQVATMAEEATVATWVCRHRGRYSAEEGANEGTTVVLAVVTGYCIEEEMDVGCNRTHSPCLAWQQLPPLN
uniref:Uncharacterized protein n=1 Tax=Oryza barthii TaxID=65489 RepID=A0A0D3GHG5_9ORYZ